MLQISLIHAQQQHRLHQVQMLEPSLCRVSHGTKRVFLGEQSVAVGAGQWLLLPANVAFDIENKPDARGYLAQVLSFSQQLVSEFHLGHAQHLPDTTTERIGLRNWHIEQYPRLDVVWLRLLQSLTDQEPLPLQKHLLFELLLTLGLSGHLWPLLGRADGRLSLLVRHMLMANPSYNWSQAVVATRFHMSSPTLRRHLATEGQTFREILESVRMAYALSRLQTTRSSINDIANDCGYASASRFAVRFRQRFGLSPRALRKSI